MDDFKYSYQDRPQLLVKNLPLNFRNETVFSDDRSLVRRSVTVCIICNALPDWLLQWRVVCNAVPDWLL